MVGFRGLGLGLTVCGLSVCALTVWTGQGGLRAAHAEVSVVEPTDAVQAPFDPDIVKPAPGSALAQVLQLKANGDLERARAQAVGSLEAADVHEKPLLRWLAAQLTRELAAPHEAAEVMLPLATSEHPLAPWARLSVAEWLEAKDPGRSLALLDSLLTPVSDLADFPGKAQASRLRARVLDKLGRRQEAIALFEQFVSDMPDETLAIQVVIPLADMLAEGDDHQRLRALTLYRRVAHRVPRSRVGQRADQRAHEMLKSLPEPMRSENREPSLEDKLLRADALLSGLRYDEARDAYAQLEELARDDEALACRARFGRAKALLDGRARNEGSELMAEVAKECHQDEERRAWARYHAGRAYAALGKNEQAIAQYEALEREAPEHRLADDALFRAAKVARDMGDHEGVFTRLSTLPQRYPNGDMHARARFSLAFQAYSLGDMPRALAALADDRSDEDGEDVQGRAAYWYARFLAKTGKKRASAEAYAALFSRSPLSFYGQLAYARLRSLDPGRARELLARLPKQGPERLTFEWNPDFTRPGFARAVALLSVGDVNLGLSELRALGLTSNAANPEHAFVVAALLDRVGAMHMGIEAGRKHMAQLLSRPPVGRTRALYELMYPQAFSPLIEEAASKASISPAYLRAVAREESGFFPRAVSRAHAYGLIQLLVPTAQAVAKGLKLPNVDPSSLMRPEVNLQLGARFIANLAASLRGQFALVPAAYNAGPSATARWLAERKDQPFDEWVENIPYDETRTYSRRVIQSYGVYHFLATGEMLELPEHLPAL